jgi:hypothetical protein
MNVARPVNSHTSTGDKLLSRCFVALDDDVSVAAMDKLRALPFLHDVAKIQLY